MRTLDKYIVKSFGVNYLISLFVLLGLYLILDLFFNFDEFTQDGEIPALTAMSAAARFYAVHSFLYFSQISGVITLFAMCFTLARMQAHNEFIGIVASGVSLYRLAFTIIVAGAVLNGLWLIDQELIIPRLAPELAQKHGEAVREGGYGVWFVRQPDDSLLSGAEFDPQAGVIHRLVLLQPMTTTGEFELITADQATYEADDQRVPQWILQRGRRLRRVMDRDGVINLKQEAVSAVPAGLTPDDIALRQARNWIQFLGRKQLTRIRKEGMAPPEQVARVIHNRFWTPIVNMIILVIGVPFFLNRHPASVVASGGRCLLACGVSFLIAFFCQNVAWDLNPAVTAWLPVLLLTPYMVVMLDRMKT